MTIPTPDEIAARLVRADALIETGDPLGELMQVQCGLARGDGGRARRIQLRKREREMSHDLWRHWFDTPLQNAVRRYRLGAVDTIFIDIDAYLRGRETIWKLAPELRHVLLHGLRYTTSSAMQDPERWTAVRDKLAPALEAGGIASLAALDTEVLWNYTGGSFDYDAVSEDVADQIAEWLVTSEHIAALTGLQLGAVTPRTLRFLASTPEAAHLEELTLKGISLVDDTVYRALSTTKLAPRRITLEKYGDPLETDERILKSPFVARAIELEVPHLRSLDVGANVRTLATSVANDSDWLRRIADGPELAAIEDLSLTLDWNASKDPLDVRAFHDPRRLDALRVLHLRSANVSLDDVRTILRGPLGQRLEVLDLNPGTAEVRDVFFDDDRAAQEWDGLVTL